MNLSKLLWIIVGLLVVALIAVSGYLFLGREEIDPSVSQVPVEVEENKFEEQKDQIVTDWKKEWEKHIPAIRSKINAFLSRSNPNGDDKITKEEFLDITKDGIPEFHITYVAGRSTVSEVFHLTGSGYNAILIERRGYVSSMTISTGGGRAAGFSYEMFLSNGDLCSFGYEYQSGGSETQFTWDKTRQLFVETSVGQECKQIAFKSYKSFVLPDRYPIEKMNVTVYIQDQTKLNQTCGATNPLVVEVPKTTAVADASLRYLFISELAKYGVYEQDSVTIENGIAKVYIYEKTPSFASCEHEHLFSVLEKTLTQYPTIKKVELYRASDRSKIEF